MSDLLSASKSRGISPTKDKRKNDLADDFDDLLKQEEEKMVKLN